MARVQIEKIVEHLSGEMRKALRQALEDTIPDVEIDDRELFRRFRRAVGRKCNAWEQVPDQYVDAE